MPDDAADIMDNKAGIIKKNGEKTDDVLLLLR